MTVTIPTSEAQYGYVVGRVVRALGDTTDADDKPDAVAASGKVTFTPKAPLGRTSDYSAFVVREKIDAPLDAQGNLVRYEGATPAGIALTVGAYRVDFALNSGSIPGFDIEVTAAHTEAAPLDLVTAAPYVPPSGVTVNTMLVPADAVVGQVLGWSASGLDWVDMIGGGGGAVSSVAGRTGAVVLSSSDLTDAASLATDAELASGLAGKANASHTHAPADITGTAVITTDPRLSDARTPTAHTHPASDISDSTATGRSLLAAADAAAARTAIGAGTSSLVIGTGAGDAKAGNYEPDLSGLVPTSRTIAGKALTGNITLAAADLTDFTEASQDVVGAMVAAAGGTYDDAGGSITLPVGGDGGGSVTFVSLVRDAAQAAEYGAVIEILWDAELEDATGLHNATVNTGRITIPAGQGGVYVVSATLHFYPSTAGGAWRAVMIYKNGSVLADTGSNKRTDESAVNPTSVTVGAVVRLAAGDYLSVHSWQDTACNISGINKSTFTAYRAGA